MIVPPSPVILLFVPSESLEVCSRIAMGLHRPLRIESGFVSIPNVIIGPIGVVGAIADANMGAAASLAHGHSKEYC